MSPTVAKLRASKWAAAFLFAFVASSAASAAVALSCVGDDLETLTLEIERVEVDGQEQADLSSYHDLDIELMVYTEDYIELEVIPEGQLLVGGSFYRQEVGNE